MTETAIVTGGTGGLGVATVARLLQEDWRVVVPGRSQRSLERLQPHPRLELIQGDMTDPAAAQAVVDRARDDRQAPLRGLVNLVGGYSAPGRVHETPMEDFAAQVRINLRPTYLATQAALREMVVHGHGGSIVCVGSRAARTPFPGAAGYVVGKAAVLALAQAVAVEYRDDGIRCNAILPSVIDTPANREAMPDARHDHWVEPEQIARVIAHLLSADSAAVSGAAIPVYGRA